VENYHIGIKIADGSFYPVLDSSEKKKKKLVLTTVKDNQEKVQIDLYRGDGKELNEARYIGSLIVENIKPAPKGEPEIELVIGIDENGTLNATAHDIMSGEKQSLSVSLESLSEEMTYDVPDFDIGEDFVKDFSEEEIESSFIEEEGGEETPEEISLTGETYPVSERDRRREHIEKKRRSPLLLILFIIFGLLIIGAAAYLIFTNLHGVEVPPLIGGTPGPVKTAESASSGTAGQVQSTEAEANKAADKGTSKEGESTAKKSGRTGTTGSTTEKVAQASSAGKKKSETGVWYSIKRGDTLWDISATYYRNPWLYPKIARVNKIKNPDLIFAGTKIFIPKE